MNTIQGAIESVSIKTTASGQTKYGLKVLGKWYNGWGNTNYKKDDLVRIEYTTTGYGNQIKFIGSPSPILPAPQGTETPKLKMHVEADAGLQSPKDTSIVRQSCIRSASMKNAGKNTTGNEDVELARIYEKYVNEG